MRSVLIACLLLLAACSTRSAPTEMSAPPVGDPLFEGGWLLEQPNLEKKIGETKITLKVDYETYLFFSPGKVKQDVVCHFREPVQKTLIVTTESPAEYSPGRIKITRPSFEKQEYKQVLAPKSGKGPKKARSVFCHSTLQLIEYEYTANGDQLILRPVAEILKLKKYKQN